MSESQFSPLAYLVERDPVRVFMEGFYFVLLGIAFYILGSLLSLLLTIESGWEGDLTLVYISSAIFIWIFPIFVIIGFLFINVGLISYITELSDRHRENKMHTPEARPEQVGAHRRNQVQRKGERLEGGK